MKNYVRDDTTTIKGNIVISSINQLLLLGEVGKNIRNEVNIQEIDPEKWYPRVIRGKIHQKIVERFGEKALYYLGLEQFNFAGVEENFFFLPHVNFKNQFTFKNFKTYGFKKKQRSISDHRKIRNRLFELLRKLHMGSKGSTNTIIAKKDQAKGEFKIVETDTIIYKLTNAVYRGHHEFNRGSIYNQIVRWIGDEWQVKVSNLEEQNEYREGLTTNVFKCEFTFRKRKEKLAEIHNSIRANAKDDFLKSVINGSEKQRKIAVEQSKKLSLLSEKIGKYIPPQIQKGLFKGEYDTEIKTRRKKCTIFFSDIKNFTSISEVLQPEDLTNYLNEYFSEMTKIALNHGATIDKYIGDAVMLFFGDPISKGEREDARACVEMSLKMQERMKDLRKKWKASGFYEPFEIRIGINTGYCNVGNFGSSQRLTYTIIGGEVNVAARLESAGDANKILMSYETYAHAMDMIEVKELEAIKMKGIRREVKVFEVVQRKKSKISKLKKTTIAKNLTNNKVTTINRKLDEINKKISSLKKLIDDLNN
ncbi:MAG: adenylate/guanylate cyclase domain-containing protein [Pseudomonadota bacterium]|nr:adenylate/guanylate cyclase domain-containing protein [Pseudomonadota bacterium]